MNPTEVTTEDLLRIVGELYVQSWVLRNAITQRAVQNGQDQIRQDGTAGIPQVFRQGGRGEAPPSEVM